MPSASFSRHERIADVIAQNLAQHIQQDIQDKNLGLVSINHVIVPRDISHAKIYVNFLASDKTITNKKRLEILNQAAKFLRCKLAASMQMRSTPELIFILDSHLDFIRNLNQLIDESK